MKIPIKKTNRKVPMSKYFVGNYYGTPLIKDISKGLENPLYVGFDFAEAIRNPKIISTYPEIVPGTKPSLWQRIKRKF